MESQFKKESQTGMEAHIQRTLLVVAPVVTKKVKTLIRKAKNRYEKKYPVKQKTRGSSILTLKAS